MTTTKPNFFAKFFKKFKFSTNQQLLNALVALYFTLLNYTVYVKVLQFYANSNTSLDAFVFSVPFFIFFACYLIFTVLALPFVHKVIVPLLMVISSAVSYNSIFFDVYFNRDMLTNIMQTSVGESSRLLTLPFVAWIVFLGIIPALLYINTQIKYRVWWREILWRLGAGALSVAGIGVIAMLFYQDYASFGRNNLAIKHQIVPTNFVAASLSKYRRYKQGKIPHQVISPNATQVKTNNNRKVTVMIVGETTRAMNWGLNGYTHQTTPLLAKRGDEIVNFNKVTSCNTFTAGSVPCMFSHLPRTEFDADKAEKQDNLLDIIQRAGVNVLWIDNDAGCKGVCNRVPTIDITQLNPPEFCHNGECKDNAILPELDKALAKVDSLNKDTLIILHTIGSHGPTYFERYSPEFRKFTPTCDTNEIQKCSNEQLVNTYDNTILYVDQFINEVIHRVEKHENWESSVIYTSDHGESLGENGVYLHSTPYDIAPATQTHVPMVMWFSKAWRANEGIDHACLLNNAKTKEFSHDNIFSTIFGAMDMKVDETYRADLDILSGCKKPKT